MVRKKNLYCKAGIVYCNRGGLAAKRLENCIAIQLLYCRQEKARLEKILYCNTPLYCDMSSLAAEENCIAIQGLTA